jgi:hypothetical protein
MLSGRALAERTRPRRLAVGQLGLRDGEIEMSSGGRLAESQGVGVGLGLDQRYGVRADAFGLCLVCLVDVLFGVCRDDRAARGPVELASRFGRDAFEHSSPIRVNPHHDLGHRGCAGDEAAFRVEVDGALVRSHGFLGAS